MSLVEFSEVVALFRNNRKRNRLLYIFLVWPQGIKLINKI